MRNHKDIKPLLTIEQVMLVLHTQKSIRFNGRVLPTRFFMCWAWMSSPKFIQHVESGHFTEVKRYDALLRLSIRKTLLNCRL